MNNYKEKLKALGGIEAFISHEKIDEDRTKVLTLSEVQEFFAKDIPQNYIEFVKLIGAFGFNGYVYVEGIDKIPIAASAKNNIVRADYFFDFGKDNASVLRQLEGYAGLPQDFLPICKGYPGDLIAISMAKSNSYGKVFYWHHESDYPLDTFLVANNFEEFIDKLFMVKEEDLDKL